MEINCKNSDKYEGDYYFDLKSGMRLVYPYDFVYRTNVKRRWVGEKINSIYKDEFRAYEYEHVVRKFERGDITVNGEKVTMERIVKDGDVIASRVHRHEHPILATPIKIVHEDDQMLVLNKPSSVPIHPCGKYRLNSILALLYKEMNYKEVHIVHRLDRLTSGLLILAKNPKVAKKVTGQIFGRTVSKEYVCKVDGIFPEGDVSCGQPIDRLCHRLGVHFVAPEGKPSFTQFRRIATDGKSSIVHCRPKTGRTHQIRIHLQYLGFPIINDPLYNSFAFGTTRGKDAKYEVASREELVNRIHAAHPLDKWIDSEIDLINEELDDHDSNKPSASNKEERERQMSEAIRLSKQIEADQLDNLIEKLKEIEILDLNEKLIEQMKLNVFNASKLTVESDCPDCKLLFKPPSIEDMYICLHALRYKTPDWDFFAEPPAWAKMDESIDFRNLKFDEEPLPLNTN